MINNWDIYPEDSTEVEDWLDRFWPAVLADPQCLVKEDRTARVFICGGMVLKEYRRAQGITGWIAGCLRSRARRAFRAGRALRDAGIPVPDMLASATTRSAGSIHLEYLLTREVPDGKRLADLLQNPELTETTLNPIIDQLGELLGDLHRAGFSNRDLKGGNVLVTHADGVPDLCIVDLDGIRRMLAAGRRRIIRDFWPVLFSLALNRWDTEATRTRLLTAYHSRFPIDIDARLLPEVIRSAIPAMPGWISVQRAIRVSGLGKRMLRVAFREETPEWENRALRYWQGALIHLEHVPSSPEAQVHAGSVDGSDKRYYFKRFLMRSRSDTFKHLVRCSRAKRTWQGNALAAQRGLGVPPMVCLIDVCEYGRTKASVLITEEVEHATTLRDLLTREGSDALDTLTRKTLLTQLGEEVGRWHSAGVVHGDMRHGNILCRQQANQWTFVFVDNERTRSTSALHERARNLVQLNMIDPAMVPLRDRARLWRAYLRTAPGDRGDKRRLRTEVLAWTQRRWRKQGWIA